VGDDKNSDWADLDTLLKHISADGKTYSPPAGEFEELSVTETYLGRLADTPTDAEIGSGNVALYFKENDDTLYKRPHGGTETGITGGGSVSFDGLTDVQTDTLSSRPTADGSQGWYFTTDGEGFYLDNGSWDLIAEHPANIVAGDLGFDPATQGELDTHAGTAEAHHTKTTSSDIDHANVSNVLSGQHHAKTVSTDLESGGSDEMSVGGLVGDLADPQNPKSHDNTDHSTDYSPQSHDHGGETISPQTASIGELSVGGGATLSDLLGANISDDGGSLAVLDTDIRSSVEGVSDVADLSGDAGTADQVPQTDGSNVSWVDLPSDVTDTRIDVADSGGVVVSEPDVMTVTESGDASVYVSDDGSGGVTVDVSATDTDTQLTTEEVQTAINNDSDHGSTASHNYIPDTNLSDSEVVDAVESHGSKLSANIDQIDGYDIQKNGSDGSGIINFKT